MTDIIQMSKGGTNFYPQTKVQAVLGLQDSLVGTNLYTDTRDFDNPNVWINWSSWRKTGEKFNGLTIMATDISYNGLSQTIQGKKSETYTFSVYARCQSGTSTSAIYYDNGTSIPVSLNDTWQRVSGTATLNTDGPISACITQTGDNKKTLLVAGLKLEKGPTATDYSLNPEDIVTSGDVQAAITNALDKVATINVISQADYDKLADKSGIYFIKG